jgi:hypothetical protein
MTDAEGGLDLVCSHLRSESLGREARQWCAGSSVLDGVCRIDVSGTLENMLAFLCAYDDANL